MNVIWVLVNEEQILIFCLKQASIIPLYQILDIEEVIAVKVIRSLIFLLPETNDWNVIVYAKSLRYFLLRVGLCRCVRLYKLCSRDRLFELHLSCIYIVLFPASTSVHVLNLFIHFIWHHQFFWLQLILFHSIYRLVWISESSVENTFMNSYNLILFLFLRILDALL